MSATLLTIQLRIAPMMPGNASATFMPDVLSSPAKALSLFLIHSPFSSLGRGLPTAAVPV